MKHKLDQGLNFCIVSHPHVPDIYIISHSKNINTKFSRYKDNSLIINYIVYTEHAKLLHKYISICHEENLRNGNIIIKTKLEDILKPINILLDTTIKEYHVLSQENIDKFNSQFK